MQYATLFGECPDLPLMPGDRQWLRHGHTRPWMPAFVKGLPVASKDYTYTEPSQLAQLLSTTQGASSAINDIFGAGTVSGVTSGVGDFISDLFGGSDPNQFESGYNSAGQMVDYLRTGGIVNSGRNIK